MLKMHYDKHVLFAKNALDWEFAFSSSKSMTDHWPVHKWDNLGRKGHSSSMVQFLCYSQLAALEYFSAPLSVLAAPQASMM